MGPHKNLCAKGWTKQGSLTSLTHLGQDQLRSKIPPGLNLKTIIHLSSPLIKMPRHPPQHLVLTPDWQPQKILRQDQPKKQVYHRKVILH